MSLREAFDAAVRDNDTVKPVDVALVEAGRKVAGQIDWAVEHGQGQEITKALYLTPHLVSILREMLATPASRKGVEKEVPGGNLARLRSEVHRTHLNQVS